MDILLPHQSRNLEYYRGRQCNKQWRDFLSVLLDELDSNVGANEVQAFFSVLGTKLASRWPLSEQSTLEGLELEANTIWNELDWGWCQFKVESAAITIIHDDWPNPDYGKETLWSLAFSALLQGIYTSWLREQGGDTVVDIRITENTKGKPLKLMYGG